MLNLCKAKTEAAEQFKKLIRALTNAGLQTEVRNGDGSSLLVFVRAADEKIFGDVVYRSRSDSLVWKLNLRTDQHDCRIKDWLNAVRQAQPDKDTQKCLTSEPLSEAERYRLVHHMITCPREEGGADITPKYGDWKNVESVFPLHNHKKNQQWLEEWTRKTFLNPQDLDNIRDAVGEKVRNRDPLDYEMSNLHRLRTTTHS